MADRCHSFGDAFKLSSEGELFDVSLHNRKETTDYYLIWKKFDVRTARPDVASA